MKQLFAILMITLLAACSAPIEPNQPENTVPSGSLSAFADKQQLIDYLEENQGTSYYGANTRLMAFDVAEAGVAMDSAMGAPAPQMKVAEEYSTTNVQVQGVDEADIIKNDGKYLYILAGETLAIVDGYPAESADLASETHIKGQPRDLFLDGDTLVIFTQDNKERLMWPEYSIMPTPRYSLVTRAFIYDISDKEDPELLDTIEITGNYFQSRMIDGKIYVITNDDVYWRDDIIDTPMIKSDFETIEPRIYYFDNPEDNYRFTTVTSFGSNGDDIESQSYLMGYANTLYMSMDNIYIAYQKNLPWRDEERERFFDVVLPVLPEEIRDEIETIRRTRMSEEAQWDRMSAVLEEMMNKLNEDDREELFEDIEQAIDEYETKRAQERTKTIIHKIAINDGDLNYDARGEVPGYLLNQFSLDESEGYLRVATNTNVWTSNNRVQHNNVYVLGDNMDIVGEIEGIAEDERIYSTRFMGDRLYMVTFRQVDPFFVVDLSDPRNPEILGELKIPGWSGYLHPYDENTIIGIGKQTKENEWGGVTQLGVKLSLFDVSDPKNPREIDTYEIGSSGSDSEVLQDHKAFLFDKERELLVLPIREVKETSSTRYYNQRIWQGAYVFKVDEDGFTMRDKIAHYEGDNEQYWSWWGSTSAVRRALYMEDVLYTISLEQVQMHSLDDLEKINEVDLPYEGNGGYYPGRPMPMEESIAIDALPEPSAPETR